MSADLSALELAAYSSDCRSLARRKYGDPPTRYIAARLKSGYFSPEDRYESLINRIVTENIAWLDVGCGCAPFPNNLRLSAELSGRCQRLVGIDPDARINENSFVHVRHQLPLEQYSSGCAFDLVTARMVVEHVANPRGFADALSRVTKPGSLVVILTVNWWSLTALAARCSPMWLHQWLKSRLWRTQARDTFRTEYKMNRRDTLRSVMEHAGFEEFLFELLPDASLFWRVPLVRNVELAWHDFSRRTGLPFVDSCILAVYRRVDDNGVTQSL